MASDSSAPSSVPTSILVVDGTNIENRCLECFGREDIDFTKFFAKVSAGTSLTHVHYFTAPYVRRADPDRFAAQSGRFNALRAMKGVTLKLGRHQSRQVTCKKCFKQFESYAEKGTDVAAAITLADCAINKRADVLYLLAGDNDYIPALQLARRCGAKVCLAAVEQGGSDAYRISDMRQSSERYLPITHEFMDDCWRPLKGDARGRR